MFDFTIHHAHRAHEIITTQDRDLAEALLSLDMLRDCFPMVRITMKRRTR